MEEDRSWISRGMPLIAATTKLAATLQRFGGALYERIKDGEARGEGLDFVEPMLAEFLEGIEELKASLPEKETLLLALESVEEILEEVAEHPTTQALGAKVKEVVASRSDEVIGKVMEATFFSQGKSEPASKETVRVIARLEELVDEAVARWLLAEPEPRKRAVKKDEEES